MDKAVINILVTSLILGSHLLVSGYAVIKQDQNGFKVIGEDDEKGNAREKKSIDVAANILDGAQEEKTAIKEVLTGDEDVAEFEKNTRNIMNKEATADEVLYNEDGNILIENDELNDYNNNFLQEALDNGKNLLSPAPAENPPNLEMLNELASLISGESKEGCSVGDTVKDEGESWLDVCNTCTCIKGQPVCTTRECPQAIGSAAAKVGPAMAPEAVPVKAAIPAMGGTPAVAVNPRVPVAAPEVKISPALAALASGKAGSSFERAALPEGVATANVAETAPVSPTAVSPVVATPVSAVAALPALALAPLVAGLAKEVALAALSAMSSTNLTASLASEVRTQDPSVAVPPTMVAPAPEVAVATPAPEVAVAVPAREVAVAESVPDVAVTVPATGPVTNLTLLTPEGVTKALNLAELGSKVGTKTPTASSTLSAGIAAMPSTTAAVEATTAESATEKLTSTTAAVESTTAESATEKLTTVTPEFNISLELTTSSSESTTERQCSEWRVKNITQEEQEECKHPWVMIGGDCLYLTSTQNVSNFKDSRNKCKEMHADADLAIPANFNVIKEYLLKKGSFLIKRNLWVGATDSCTSGEPQWLNGSTINNTLWLDGEPTVDNMDNGCVVVNINNTKLITKSCTEEYKFICQKSAKKASKTKNPCYNWGVNKTNPEECKLPWVKIGNGCLLLSSNHNVSMFNDSRDFCKSIHAEADLAITNDFQLIKEYLQKKGSTLVNKMLWVGGSDSCTPEEPRWLNGKAISSNLWQHGKPTVNNKAGNECVVLDVENSKLLTRSCNEEHKPICQKSAKIIV